VFLLAVFNRIYRGWPSSFTGDFGAARDNVKEALQIAESADHPFTKVWAHVGIGLGTSLRDSSAAVAALQSSLALWRHGDWAFMFPWVAAPSGRANATAERTEEAIGLLQQAVDRPSA
jgi:hypothetical protein